MAATAAAAVRGEEMEDGLRVVWQGPALLGEGPLWDHREQALYFVDVTQPALWRFDPATSDAFQWQLPSWVGAIFLRASGGLMAACGDGVGAMGTPARDEGRYSGECGDILDCPILVPLTEGRTDVTLNDGKIDPQGRMWIGTAQYLGEPHPYILDDDTNTLNPDPADSPPGQLFLVRPPGDGDVPSDGLSAEEVVAPVTTSNGIGWSPDGRTMYYTDSQCCGIHAYDFDGESGTISNKRVFASTRPVDEGAVTDGMTIDCEGYVWCALFNGGKVVRFSPSGELDRVVKLPVSRPTCCAFGGPGLRTLYITTCSQDRVRTRCKMNLYT
eukprot:jgi/Chlat1/5541/Chrsp369S05349